MRPKCWRISQWNVCSSETCASLKWLDLFASKPRTRWTMGFSSRTVFCTERTLHSWWSFLNRHRRHELVEVENGILHFGHRTLVGGGVLHHFPDGVEVAHNFWQSKYLGRETKTKQHKPLRLTQWTLSIVQKRCTRGDEGRRSQRRSPKQHSLGKLPNELVNIFGVDD